MTSDHFTFNALPDVPPLEFTGDECLLELTSGNTWAGHGDCVRDDHFGRPCVSEGVDFQPRGTSTGT